MTDNLDLLPEAVRASFALLNSTDSTDSGGNSLPISAAWIMIRTELLRLARENEALNCTINAAEKLQIAYLDRAEQITNERDELRRRIESAPACTLSRSDVDAWDLPDNWSGKRVRLVEDGK